MNLDPYQLGVLFGQLIWPTLALWGLFKSFSIAKRPETSPLCAYSLGVVLLGVVIMLVSSIAGRYVPPEHIMVYRIAFAGITLFGGLIYATGFVLAIVGLANYRTPYNQGRSQAIWALCLSIFFLLSCFVNFGRTVVALANNPTNQNVPTVLTEEGEVYEDKELNVRYRKPGRPWVELDPKIHNEEAALILRNPRTNNHIFIIAERIGTNASFSPEVLESVARSNLESVAGKHEFGETRTEVVNGITYRIFDTKIENFSDTGQTFYYQNWNAFQNGYSLQFIANGKNSGVAQVASDMVKRLEFIDPDAVFEPDTIKLPPLNRADRGYSIDLSELRWSDWPNLDTGFKEAEFAALKDANKAMMLLSLHLGDDLDPNIDILAGAFLKAVFDRSHPKQSLNRAAMEMDGASGISFDSISEDEDEYFFYRHRVLRKGPMAYFITGWIWEDNPGEHAALDEALDSVELVAIDPSNPVKDPIRIVKTRASVMNQIGLGLYRKRKHAEGLPFFQDAFRRNPANGQFFENVVDAMKNSNRFKEAVALIDEKGAPFSENTNLLIYKGEYFKQAEESEEARVNYQKAFAQGHKGENDLLDYLNVLVGLERRADGIVACDEYRKNIPSASSDIERWKASLLAQTEKYDEAIALLDDLHEAQPTNSSVIDNLLDTLIDAEKYAETLARCKTFIERENDSAVVYFYQGKAHLKLKSLHKAKESFEIAHSKAENDQEIKSYLDHTLQQLGKSNVSLVKRKIEPVSLPTKVVEKIDQAQGEFGDALDKGQGATVLKRSIGIDFRKNKPKKLTMSQKVEIHTSAGVKNFSTLRFRFDPSRENFFVNEVKVLDPKTGNVTMAQIDDFYLEDVIDDGLATGEKILVIPVPGLKIGSHLYYTTTRQTRYSVKKMPFESFAMQRYYPCAINLIYITGDVSEVDTATNGSFEIEENDVEKIYFLSNTAALKSEDLQPWASSFSPWLWVGSRKVGWSELGEGYLNRLQVALSSSADIDLPEELQSEIDLVSTNEERIQLVVDYVQSQLSYQGIEFGTRGQIPNTLDVIEKNKYGDCKDHSLVIVKYLEALGISAHLCLVSTDAPMVESLPSLDQFNHMIVYIPSGTDSPFVDATMDHFPLGVLAPENLLFEKSLVLEPGNVRLQKIEATNKNGSQINTKRVVSFDPAEPEGTTVSEMVAFHGYSCYYMRSYLNRIPRGDRIKKLGEVLSRHGSPTVTDLEIEHLENPRFPLKVKMKYTLPRHLETDDKGVAKLLIPAIWENYYCRREIMKDRKHPFELLSPLGIQSRCEINVPKGYKLNTDLNSRNQEIETDFAKWSIKTERKGTESLEFLVKGNIKTGTFESKQYNDYVRSINAGSDTLHRSIQFDRAEQ